MSRKLVVAIRLAAIVIAVALLLQFLQPNRAFAQGITLTPNQGNAGQSVRVDGTGFAYPDTITIKFDGVTVATNPATITTGTGGAFSNVLFNVPGTAAAGAHTVTAKGTGGAGDTATATFQIGSTTSSLSINKTVDSFTCGVGQCAASTGEVLTYQLSFANNGGSTSSNVTISDTLALGQMFIDATPSAGTCGTSVNPDGTVNVSCSIGSVTALGSPGSTGTVVIRTRVTGTTGSINNTSSISGTGSTSAGSNTTYVTVVNSGNQCGPTTYPCSNPCYPYAVGTCNPCPTTFNCQPCTYNCYPCNNATYTCTPCTTNYSCYPCNGTYNCNPCPTTYNCNTCPTTYNCNTCPTNYSCQPCYATYNCNPYPCGAYSCNPNPCGAYGCNPNPCGTCNPNPNPCGTCNPNPNPCGTSCSHYGAPTYCGVVTAYSPAAPGGAGYVTMNGSNYNIMAGTTFPGVTVVQGQYYCFLYNTNSYITGCLSSIVTGIEDNGPVKAGREIFY